MTVEGQARRPGSARMSGLASAPDSAQIPRARRAFDRAGLTFGCAWLLLLVGAASGAPEPLAADSIPPFPEPQIPWAPRHYSCPRATGAIEIDGRMLEEDWVGAPWTEPFVDIRGPAGPTPRYRTRARMLWDDSALYVAAEMEEPHVWATLTQRDTVIYYDNDFEVFIDPDGDTHEYYELEVNARGTEWDLLIIRPYRDGGPAVHAWDIPGLRSAVHVDGTLNDPHDSDRGWSIEIAFPWPALRECAPGAVPPAAGDCWRINFSRVQWRHEVRGGRYRKQQDPATGRPLPEDNWVWSPQGLINMHYPEMWGFVEFVAQPASAQAVRDPGASHPAFLAPHERTAWLLRRVYYCQRTYWARHGCYAAEWAALDLTEPADWTAAWPPQIAVTPHGFVAWVTGLASGGVAIRSDGRVWRLAP